MRQSKARAAVARCMSCAAPLAGGPAFCTTCGRPTTFASYDEKTAWEVAQWRAYAEPDRPAPAVVQPAPARSVAVLDFEPAWQRRLRDREQRATERHAERRDAALAAQLEPAPEIADTPAPQIEDAPAPQIEDAPAPQIEDAPDPQIENTVESGFERPAIYRLCMSCGGADWVLRAGRNEDGTYRYWCVRCARAFRTDLRIAWAAKPALISASVVGVVVLAASRLW